MAGRRAAAWQILETELTAQRCRCRGGGDGSNLTNPGPRTPPPEIAGLKGLLRAY